MRFAGFVLILGERPCLRAMPRGLRRQVHVHQVSRGLTIPHVARSTAAPQNRECMPLSLVKVI